MSYGRKVLFCHWYIEVKTKITYDINRLKSRDILDPIYLPIEKSVDILPILYKNDLRYEI